MLHENIGMSALIVQGYHTLEKGWKGGGGGLLCFAYLK